MAPDRPYHGYILDLDGTVYRGGQPIPGAPEAIAALRGRGARLLFLSNNALLSRSCIAQRLTGMGVPTRPDEVINSAWVLAQELAVRAPGARCYVVGEEPLRRDMQQAGLRVVGDGDEADWVVLSADRTLTWQKLKRVLQLVRSGVPMAATHPDPTIPSEDGDVPDAGAVIAAAEASTGQKVRWMAGKPSPLMLKAALAALALPVESCLVVGDRLDTDIRLGAENGVDTALVLTGIATEADALVSAWRPTYVVRSLADLARL